MKKVISLFLAIVMMLSLCACNNSEKTSVEDGDAVTVKLVTLSNASWPIDGDCKAWEYIREGTKMNLEVQAIPSSDFYSKIPLMYAAPETLPDLMAFDNKPSTDRYAVQGALIALDDVAEYMPNYKAFLEKIPEADAKRIVNARKAADGKVYYSPTYGREKMQGVRAWLYRKDIFEKNNLSVPTNQEELFEVCRKLKTIYPEAYPFSMRNGMQFIDMIGSEWKPYFCRGVYYDYNAEKWSYGAVEPTMLEILTFFKQMVDENLIMADFLTINAQTWQELITSDRGFIFPDYQTRIDFFTPLVRANNPEFTLTAMVPPKMNEETGTTKLAKFNLDAYGLVLCNTNDDERIANAAKYLDWMYSDEAEELLSWGKEGETYEVVDGKRVYITDETGAQPNTLYGFSLPGTVARFDPDAVDAFESELISETRHITIENMMDEVNPTMWLAFNDDESEVTAQIGTSIDTYTKEMVSKFVLGQEPLSSFDNFVAQVNDMGLEKLLEVYTVAYDRVK